jgi:hypothetical protein
MVVTDLQRSMSKYIEYGMGPIYVLKFHSKNVSDMYINRKRKNYSMNVGIIAIGDIRFELIEPIDESIYSEYHEVYGEGIIHHLKLGVHNYQKILEYFSNNGIKEIQSGHQLGDKGENVYTYLDSRSTLGFIAEIVKVSPDFIKPQPDYWYPEDNSDIPEPVFKRLTNIGIVVRDLSKKIEQYENLYGLRCECVKQFNFDNIADMYVYDRRKDYSASIAFFNLENVQIKLIEAHDDSIFSQFYDRFGEGIVHHLGMEVDNYQKTLGQLKSKGIMVIQSGKYLDKLSYSYLQTSDDLNFITEIIELNASVNNQDEFKFLP